VNPVYFLGYTIAKTVGRLSYKYRVINPERLIEEGPAIVASNHASFLDPPMVGVAFRKPIFYLARKTLFDNPIFGWIYRNMNSIPVDQKRPGMSSLKTIIRLVKAGNRVLIFPEGQRSWDGTLGEGMPGVGFVVAKSRAPVIPVRVFGAAKALPRGAKFPRRSKITIVVGEPIRFSEEELNSKEKANYQRISDRIMDAIGALELEPKG
jgi:1-acyl-sn-glycerol-3-phosphate acyltransferase